MTNKADGTIPIESKISGHGQNSNRYHSLTIGGKVDSFHPLELVSNLISCRTIRKFRIFKAIGRIRVRA